MSKDATAKVLTYSPFQNINIDRSALKAGEDVPVQAAEESALNGATAASAEEPSAGHVTPDASHPAGESLDDFLLDDGLLPWVAQYASQEQQRVVAEARELMSANRWDDILALFHPVENKAPELVETGMDLELRLKVSFALSQLDRYDEAIQCLLPVIERYPDEFIVHSGIAYSAYMSLYAAQNRRILLTPPMKQQRIALAHHHFEACRRIRPDSVTAHYREAMLFKQVEHKTRKAVPLFQKAIAIWEGLSHEQKELRHQERTKYIRCLYHLASCHLDNNAPSAAHQALSRCMKEDAGRETLALIFKHFAMGKVLNALGRHKEALDHLETALASAAKGQATDFVSELSARCALALNDPHKAHAHISRIPRDKRRPYVQWTEADVLWALKRTEEAKGVLVKSLERDRRSRHKSLLRLAQILYREGQVEKALDRAREANQFRQSTYGNEHDEALFWMAGCLFKLGRFQESMDTLQTLRRVNPRHPHGGKLEAKVRCAMQARPG